VGLRLEAAGHKTYRPTAEGAAERTYALSELTSLDRIGGELASFLFYEDLTDVILVATSSGGMIAARAAEGAPERIRRLVFIDALVPRPGENVADILGREPWDPKQLAYGMSPEEAKARAFADLEPGLREWAAARYTRQARAPQEDRVELRRFWARRWQVDVLQ